MCILCTRTWSVVVLDSTVQSLFAFNLFSSVFFLPVTGCWVWEWLSGRRTAKKRDSRRRLAPDSTRILRLSPNLSNFYHQLSPGWVWNRHDWQYAYMTCACIDWIVSAVSCLRTVFWSCAFFLFYSFASTKDVTSWLQEPTPWRHRPCSVVLDEPHSSAEELARK